MTAVLDRSASDRNMLFGILPLQMNFIDRDALVAAIHAWVLDKQRPFGEILLAQEKLTADQVGALDALIVQHLRAHGGDPECSLQALRATSTVKSTIRSFKHGTIRPEDAGRQMKHVLVALRHDRVEMLNAR